MSYTTSANFASLVLSINFDRIDKETNNLPFINDVFDTVLSLTPVKVNNSQIILTYTEALDVKILCKIDKPKLDSGACATITACTNASLCADENKPVICNEDYIYDPSTTTNPSCVQTCSNKLGRGPMSTLDKSFCNRKCDSNMTKCEGITAAETKDNFNNNKCNSGFDRYGYKCLNQNVSKKSKLKNVFRSNVLSFLHFF